MLLKSWYRFDFREKLIYCVLQLNARDLWLVVCNVLSQIYMPGKVDPSFFGLTTKSPVFHTQTCFFFFFFGNFGNFRKCLGSSSLNGWSRTWCIKTLIATEGRTKPKVVYVWREISKGNESPCCLTKFAFTYYILCTTLGAAVHQRACSTVLHIELKTKIFFKIIN